MVTRKIGKICPIFQKVAKIIAKPKKAKQPTLKVYLKVQIIYICYLMQKVCKNVCVHQGDQKNWKNLPNFSKSSQNNCQAKKSETTYFKSLFVSPNCLHLLFNNYLQEGLCPPG
jgi:hypothetical protein